MTIGFLDLKELDRFVLVSVLFSSCFVTLTPVFYVSGAKEGDGD
jgi:hypothetical protein